MAASSRLHNFKKWQIRAVKLPKPLILKKYLEPLARNKLKFTNYLYLYQLPKINLISRWPLQLLYLYPNYMQVYLTQELLKIIYLKLLHTANKHGTKLVDKQTKVLQLL